jgi:glycosyltransferase involved in cell wall biosynthesis
MQSGKAKWICCQIGAREHYAVPRVIHSVDSLAGLITESWVPPDHLARLVNRLGERFHPELNLAPVHAWNSATIAFELSARVNGLGGWPLTIKRNRWFQQRGLEALRRIAPRLESDGNRPILFAYSYAALELLRFAKARGWQTVLGQIDGGLRDEELVANEHNRHKGLTSHWQRAPSEYWQSWKAECSLADTIIVNSDWAKGLLVDAGIDAAKLKTIPVAYQVGAEALKFERVYPTEFSGTRPLRVLFLGAFALRKGAVAVLEAMRLLEDKPVEFWIVGSVGVNIPPALRESPKVRWVGSVSRESTADYYRNADVFLFPTISDGFGMTQVEARGWKLPVIATPFCAQLIKHGTNGLIITEVNGESLNDAIRYLLNNPTYLNRLSEGSAEEYDAYSVASVREEILSLGI